MEPYPSELYGLEFHNVPPDTRDGGVRRGWKLRFLKQRMDGYPKRIQKIETFVCILKTNVVQYR